jgi:predicted glycosyltransferase
VSLRVAFYSHNGFGLGHVRRNLTLARALLRQRPDADLLVITGSTGLHEGVVERDVRLASMQEVEHLQPGRLPRVLGASLVGHPDAEYPAIGPT